MALLVVSLPLVFETRRIAGAVTVLASALCLPLYLYVLAPGPFRWIFRGEYKTLLQANFVWEKWSMIGVLALQQLHTWVFGVLPGPLSRMVSVDDSVRSRSPNSN